MEEEALYATVKQMLSIRRLNEISHTLINAYRGGNISLLTAIHRSIREPDAGSSSIPPNKIFLRLIKFFHPDRYAALVSEVEQSYARGDVKKLGFYRDLLSADRPATRELNERYSFDFKETFGYDEEEPRYAGFGMNLDDSSGTVSEHDFDLDFLDALKAELFGNLDFDLSVHDLDQIEGDLVLRGYGIQNLEGLDYCVNITKLDLSENRIDNLSSLSGLGYLMELYASNNDIWNLEPLAGLENLEILDLSGNDIEDADVLAGLPNLKVLNLKGNPVGSLEKLKAAGITVLI